MLDGEQVGWACPDCKMIFQGEQVEEIARDHCHHTCEDCGVEKKRDGWIICAACRVKRDKLKEQHRFEKAEKVAWEDYEGYVFDPRTDEFYDSPGAFLEACEDLAPSYVWACFPEELSFDAQNIIENALSDHYEDASSNIPDEEYEVLQSLLDEWAKRQGITSYHPDYSRAVTFMHACQGCGRALIPGEVLDGVLKCEDCTPPSAA